MRYESVVEPSQSLHRQILKPTQIAIVMAEKPDEAEETGADLLAENAESGRKKGAGS